MLGGERIKQLIREIQYEGPARRYDYGEEMGFMQGRSVSTGPGCWSRRKYEVNAQQWGPITVTEHHFSWKLERCVQRFSLKSATDLTEPTD